MTADRSLKIIFGDRKLCDFWHITWKEFSIWVTMPKQNCIPIYLFMGILGSPVPGALLHYPLGAHACKTGPRTPSVWRLGSPAPAAVAMVLVNPATANKTQGSCCLQTWVPHAWKPTH
jgi:hypothetical protein